ncbi:hypothetical protein NDU88_002162 [Pleurodeles waltl]|uniref:Uncharacterized protein n=1 Tax=Pleurodeles waltl TaxID=8319 RepID=A0AAV7V9S7_PLEWA|nr:hypothetical protein NDU88_002162 [Pleurodeles waltl]
MVLLAASFSSLDLFGRILTSAYACLTKHLKVEVPGGGAWGARNAQTSLLPGSRGVSVCGEPPGCLERCTHSEQGRVALLSDQRHPGLQSTGNPHNKRHIHKAARRAALPWAEGGITEPGAEGVDIPAPRWQGERFDAARGGRGA